LSGNDEDDASAGSRVLKGKSGGLNSFKRDGACDKKLRLPALNCMEVENYCHSVAPSEAVVSKSGDGGSLSGD
jgi:hypothetical protein